MVWTRNLEAVAQGKPSYVVEAEFGSELRIPGLLSYAGGAILCGPATFDPDAAGLFKYVLRLRVPGPGSTEEEEEYQPPAATKDGYVFREGPVGELLALFSLRLQARFFLLSISQRELGLHDLPMKTEFSPKRGRIGPSVDAVVFSEAGERNFASQLAPFLDELRLLPAEQHMTAVLAADHYARALRQVGLDEEMVFVRLVSAVEIASVKQAIRKDPLAENDPEHFLQVERLTPEQLEDLKVLFRTRKTRQRFLSFLEEHSEGFFAGEPIEPAHTQVTPANLRAVGDAVYRARSGYLHAGLPMYLSRPIPQFTQWHMDPSVGMYLQDRYFSSEQKLPRADFFHRLVRHCVLRYLRGLIRPSSRAVEADSS
jgi:hypothetical protein